MATWIRETLDWLFPNRWRKDVRERLERINVLLEERLDCRCIVFQGWELPFRAEVVQQLTDIERKVRCLPPCSTIVGIAVQPGSGTPRS